MNQLLSLGLDVGSTTVKAVVMDSSAVLFSDYRRHNADVRGELARLISDVQLQFPNDALKVAITGSGGLGVAQAMGVDFVQEVIASTEAIERLNPEADVVIELGGEDAKITYLHPHEQRMNGTCAGGTGAFIDQMATLLTTDAAGLDELAAQYSNLYPIASRCGVFAKSDVQPLLNQGAAHSDIAASVFQAVANQTIAGLACGHPITGNVILLGGPLHFLPQLREAYRRALGSRVTSLQAPEDGQLYVAMGAAMLAKEPALSLSHLIDGLRKAENQTLTKTMRPLFLDERERAEFDTRHAQHRIPRGRLSEAVGPVYVGIDAGSTTIKSVVIDESRSILFSTYGSNEGDPVAAALAISRQIREALPADAYIARACVTGYGEALVQAATHADAGVIETMAHYRAAREVAPGVTSVIDIGGQDMKFMKIRGGAVDSIAVNEACSSGCGSFLQTFASTMNTGLTDFAKAGCEAEHPVDLGSRCTVFMNSSVKQAQKEGATLGDISAGLSYSVVRNALYKVIKLRDAGELGSTVVVQGGTFLNDAVLRAFELLTGVEVVRPDIAGLMGAYGAALSALPTPMAKPAFSHFVRNGTTTSRDPARNTSRDPARNTSRHPARNEVESQDLSRFNALSSLRSCDFAQDDGVKKSPDERVERLASDGVIVSPFQTRDLDAFRAESEQRTCQLCQNHCKLTITTFDDGVRNVSGNRCERGASLDRRPKKSEIPNLYDYKYQRAFGYRRLKESDAKRGDIGIPRALGMYEDYPLWFTVLTKLGFRVILSGRSNHELFEAGMESIPAENTCYPAKLAHGHIEWLLDKGIDTIWFPCVSYERKEHSDNHYNCPIVSFYPETLEHNIDRLKSVRFLDPHLNLNNPEFLAKRLVEVFADWNVTLPEAKEAVEAGYAEWDAFHADVRAEGDRALQYAREHGMRSIVLAGRPYHVDPEINHGIPDAIVKLGMAVLTEDSLREGEYVEHPMRVMDQWAYHSRLYEAAAQVRNAPDVSLVQLNSFGCGLDAITTDMVQEIIESAGDVYTVIKIDEVSNLGAATIRLRSLAAAMDERSIGSVEDGRTSIRSCDYAQDDGVRAARNRVTTALGLELNETTPLRPELNETTPLRLELNETTQLRLELNETTQLRPELNETTPLRPEPNETTTTRHPALKETTTTRHPALNETTTTRHPARNEVESQDLSRTPAPTVPTPRISLKPDDLLPFPADKRNVFTAQMRKTHTVFAPQMSPIHFRMLEPIFNRAGYKVHVLEHATDADVECGLKYVNNDVCYPAILVVGQLVNAFISGEADPETSAVACTQTGGMCRDSNYAGMLRKALRSAGYGQVPVIALSTQGFEENPGFTISLPMIHHALQALVIGDTLMTVLHRVRPYERDLGSADALYERWDAISREYFECDGRSETYGGKLTYKKLIRSLVREFDELPLLNVPRKPRVGIVGEVLVKYQPDANNNIVKVIEEEGCEAVLPGLSGFLQYGTAGSHFRHDALGLDTWKDTKVNDAVIWAFERYEKPMREALSKSNGKFDVPEKIDKIRELAEPLISIGTEAGEGWFMVGEMIELIRTGTPNIVCCQPFACLPNHVVGRGMFKALRELYPEANITSIDYDPGASEVNQLNRLKLMMATAMKNADATERERVESRRL